MSGKDDKNDKTGKLTAQEKLNVLNADADKQPVSVTDEGLLAALTGSAETASTLIANFGTLAGTLEASEQELRKVCKLSEKTIFNLKIIPKIANIYVNEGVTAPDVRDEEAVAAFLMDLFVGEMKESVYMICSRAGKSKVFKIAEGTCDYVSVPHDTVLNTAVKFGARYVVIAHNHPDAQLSPSPSDIASCRRLRDSFEVNDIEFSGYYIVADGSYLLVK